MPTAPNSLSFWHDLAANDPVRAAHTLITRVQALAPGQRRAIFANEPDESALATAFDASIDDGGPLAGVPFVVKDLFAVAGRRIGAGSKFLPDVRHTETTDSAIVSRFRELGAVYAGTTHLHEFAFGITGENPHFGDCANPRFPGRLSGGSSSGSAAAVAAGIVPLAIGTDTGGSIRVPAAFCGLWGHRGTPHAPFIADAFPLAPTFDTAGWFTDNRQDLIAVTNAVHGEPARRARAIAYVPAAMLDPAMDARFSAALDAAAARKAEPLPHDLIEAFLATTADAATAFTVIQGTEAAAAHTKWLDARRDEYDPAVWARIDRGRRRSSIEVDQAQLTRARIRDVFATILDRFDALLLPCAPFPALAKPECSDVSRTRLLRLTTPASHAGLPAIVLPVPAPDGLSAGLQCVTRQLNSLGLTGLD